LLNRIDWLRDTIDMTSSSVKDIGENKARKRTESNNKATSVSSDSYSCDRLSVVQ